MSTVPVATTKSRVRQRTYVAPNRNQVLLALYRSVGENGKRVPLTAKDAGTTPAYMLNLENPDVGSALVRRVGVEQTGRPGRPAVLWALTDAGVKRIGQAVGDLDRKGKRIR
ncbi:hypothetical protein [Candidatus Solirubrobacter pratensis]|uniref:hypothetical protein n=1 Tax=Candidatus Solirubrobacter pratensis TaxID=1298857 RepID=UPI00040E0AD0|nr:hypothetical protein [Candidatus Solirubrobacter pratensis]